MRGRFLLLMGLAALLAGCAAPPGKPMPESWMAPESTGELVLYRTKATVLAIRNTYFYADGVHIATLGSADYTRVVLPVGVHRLSAKWDVDLMAKEMVINVQLRQGAKSYVRLAQSGSQSTYSGIRFGWQMAVVPEGVGSAEVQGLDARAPVAGANR